MVTILGLWESSWMEANRTERRLWKQTIQAFNVDMWAMAPQKEGPFTSPIQYSDLASMVFAYPDPKTFLVPENTANAQGLKFTPLAEYEHPENAVYVFGNVPENLTAHIEPDDDIVCVRSPSSSHMFAPCVLAVVLHDRYRKLK